MAPPKVPLMERTHSVEILEAIRDNPGIVYSHLSRTNGHHDGGRESILREMIARGMIVREPLVTVIRRTGLYITDYGMEVLSAYD